MGGSQKKKIRGLLRLYKYTCYILCRIKYHTLSIHIIYKKIPIIIIIVTMTWMRNKKFNVLLLLPSSSPKPRGRRDTAATVEDDDDGRPILYTTESLRVVHTQARSSTRWRRGKIIRSNTVGPDTQRALFLRADNIPTRLPPRESRIESNRIVVGSPGWRSHDQSLIHDPVLLCAECDFNPRSSSPRLL